jgi:amidophosphoribosyltransferase
MNGYFLEDDYKPREECGVFGIYGHPNAAQLTYFGLFALQHRGQESAGIVVGNNGHLTGHTGMGLTSDVFTPEIINTLAGPSAVGHVRYSTTGSSHAKNAQPLLVDYARGQLAVAHNGNLVDAYTLRKELESSGSIFQTTTDSEIIIHLMARPYGGTFADVLLNITRRIEGAYSLAMLTPEALYGVRDPHGFRPLSLGKLDNGYVLASETCAFDLIGAEFIRDVEPGEIVIIDGSGVHSLHFGHVSEQRMCIFEYVYFARPDSKIFGRTVHLVRKELGRQLAREHPVDADLVISIPDSGNSAAMGYAEESGIPYEMGYIRNHYVGRTFIAPSQGDRDIKVRVKLNVMPEVVKDKRIVIVDDSIVRGTTTFSRIIELKKAGAKEVHVRISCPPTRFPCFYGVDLPSHDQLIAARHTVEEIAQFLNADSLGYLSAEGMVTACGGGTNFCRACYDGNYPVPIEDPVDKEVMEKARECIELDRPAGVTAAIGDTEPVATEAEPVVTEEEPAGIVIGQDTGETKPESVKGESAAAEDKPKKMKKNRKKTGTESKDIVKNVNDLPDLFG